MGTSSSYRAPAKPRWNAFLAALTSGAPLERVRSELFNAGNEWEEALAGPAVASFATTLVALYDDFPGRIAATDRPDLVVMGLVAEAKAASADAGFTPALAVAERAFLRLIISTVDGLLPTPGEPSVALAERWREARGSTPAGLVAEFVGELVGQLAKHVVDREAGRLATTGAGIHSNQLAAKLAAAATEVGRSAAAEHLAGQALTTDTWPALVHRAFDEGRAIPTQNP
jgi:hypothetical protein